MPELRLNFPIVLRSREDDLTLAVAIGVPECSVADKSPESALAGLEKLLKNFCERLLPDDLVSRLIQGQPALDWIPISLRPPNRSLAWRDEIVCPLAVVKHRLESGLHAAYLPSLQLTVMTDNASAIDDLIRRQVIAALRRENLLSIAGIASLGSDQICIERLDIELKLKAPVELLSAERLTKSGAVKSLKKYAVELKPGAQTAIEHREQAVNQLSECLREPYACSVLLVGPPGVGKTAVFKELVRRHEQLGFADKTFWMTEGSAIVAGATGFGMWQERCDELLEGIKHRRGILHVGNLFELIEAGRINGSEGVAAFLAGPMRSGRLIAVAECTEQQYALLERKDPAVTSCFERISLEATSEEQTRDILLRESVLIESQTNLILEKKKNNVSKITIDPGAIQVLDRLHRRFTSDVAAPGRPLQWLRQWTDELRQASDIDTVLDANVVSERFSATSGLPRFLIDPTVKPDLTAIKQRLQNEVIGQEDAVDTLVGFIATLAADLQRPFRPLASLLLIGPTGVGKTETAKALARLIYNDAARLSRIDMSEFSTPGSAERLIGNDCSGEADGALTGAVRRQPFSVLLLDEIEKAHSSVFDILLQVLGEARLTDNRGRTASFSNCIVLMTSNLGADTFKAQAMGLTDKSIPNDYANHFDRSVRSYFRPEFYNRIDRILAYRPLPMDVVRVIANRRVEQVASRAGLREKGVGIEYGSEIIDWLAERGYQPEYGARPLVRAIEKELVIPLSEHLSNVKTAPDQLQGAQIQLSLQTSSKSGDSFIKTSPFQLRSQVGDAKQGNDQLCREATKMRRMGQAIQGTDKYREVEYQITQLERQIDRLQSDKGLSHHHRRKLDKLIHEHRYYSERLQTWKQLISDLENNEDELLTAFYRRQTFDSRQQNELTGKLMRRLWDVLLDMLVDPHARSKPCHLFVMGMQPLLVLPLIRAYLLLADRWTIEARIKLLRASGEPLDDRWLQVVDPSAAYSFQERKGYSIWKYDELSQSLGGLRREQKLQNDDDTKEIFVESSTAVIDAWKYTGSPRLESIPADAVGFMLTFANTPITTFLRQENGMHVFRPAEHPDGRHDVPFLVEVHYGEADLYQVPKRLADRKLEPLGDLRRLYNAATESIKDVSLNSDASFGERLESSVHDLIEQALEKAVWGQVGYKV